MKTILEGMRLVWSNSKLRRFVWKPLWKVVPLMVLLIAASAFGMNRLSDWLTSIWGVGQLTPVLTILFTVAMWWVLAGPVFFTLTVFLSAMDWEQLAAEVESTAGIPPIEVCQTSLSIAVKDNLARLPRTIGVGLACAVTAPLFFGTVSAFIAGWQARYDFTAPAFGRRGIRWPAQKAAFGALPHGKELILASAVCAWIPILNILMIPGLVAAGTLLVARNQPTSSPLEK